MLDSQDFQDILCLLIAFFVFHFFHPFFFTSRGLYTAPPMDLKGTFFP